MSLYSVAVDTVVLDFAFMDHGEDIHASDRVWVRGSNTAAWLPIADLNALAGPVGLYEVVEDLNVSGLLASAGQDFTGTFEVRFGQEDDSPSTGIANGDGFTFDDFAMRLIGPDDVAASAVISPVAGECSSSAMMIGVEVTNFGGNVVSNVPVDLTITDAAGNVSTVSGVAAGPLGFLDTATVTVGPVDLFAGGLTDFVVTSQLLGDTDPANDVYIETVDLALGAVPLDPIDGACPTYPTTLTVQAEGATVYTWWDAPTGGIQLGSGPAFTTPVIGSETTYWVQRNTTTGSAGALDNTVGTGGYFPDYDDGLVFDVAVPSQLDSVLIYADAAGDLTINLEDDTGMEIDSMTIAVSTGANVVPVGFSLPVGTGFVMHAQGTTVPNLFRNTGGGLFPYTTAGSEVTVTGNVNGLLDFYYYFYDWQVTAGGCADERTEVVVPVGIAECDTDLEVLVTSGPEVVPGASLVYTVDVTNHGPDPLAGYQLTSGGPSRVGDRDRRWRLHLVPVRPDRHRPGYLHPGHCHLRSRPGPAGSRTHRVHPARGAHVGRDGPGSGPTTLGCFPSPWWPTQISPWMSQRKPTPSLWAPCRPSWCTWRTRAPRWWTSRSTRSCQPSSRTYRRCWAAPTG